MKWQTQHSGCNNRCDGNCIDCRYASNNYDSVDINITIRGAAAAAANLDANAAAAVAAANLDANAAAAVAAANIDNILTIFARTTRACEKCIVNAAADADANAAIAAAGGIRTVLNSDSAAVIAFHAIAADALGGVTFRNALLRCKQCGHVYCEECCFKDN
ncbi:unnamed protein product [Adineta steineri]|uniref:Uncharacterized protein n=1 Tax=Adineta steineri TaxID=433720 RepID=A0A813S357_9BILA|nr:unnamed protein product [Adineta steineri]CAF3679631.1 unnamed protein product [Adineta steineri]